MYKNIYLKSDFEVSQRQLIREKSHTTMYVQKKLLRIKFTENAVNKYKIVNDIFLNRFILKYSKSFDVNV